MIGFEPPDHGNHQRAYFSLFVLYGEFETDSATILADLRQLEANFELNPCIIGAMDDFRGLRRYEKRKILQ
jgi:hypothetical protein